MLSLHNRTYEFYIHQYIHTYAKPKFAYTQWHSTVKGHIHLKVRTHDAIGVYWEPNGCRVRRRNKKWDIIDEVALTVDRAR